MKGRRAMLDEIRKRRVLALRAEGYSVARIQRETGWSLTWIRTVVSRGE